MNPAVRLGPYTIRALSDGRFRLDGGAMFGVVPKVIWEKLTTPDADNQIPLALRPFLVQGNGKNILIEPGIGTKWDEKGKRIYKIEHSSDVVDQLESFGVSAEQVTDVFVSHLHWDHIGAATRFDESGKIVPVFTQANHWVSGEELKIAARDDHPRRASYRVEDILPLLEAGLIKTFSGAKHSPIPGITQYLLQGHSCGTSLVTVEGGGKTAIFWDDIVPTVAHIQPPYIMAYDIDQSGSFAVRTDWIGRAADGEWISMFYHDPEHAFGIIRREGKKFRFEPLAKEALVP